jgi:hypothetical protein
MAALQVVGVEVVGEGFGVRGAWRVGAFDAWEMERSMVLRSFSSRVFLFLVLKDSRGGRGPAKRPKKRGFVFF